jgi:hypothetical protein
MVRLLLALLLITQLATLGMWWHWLYIDDLDGEEEMPDEVGMMHVAAPHCGTNDHQTSPTRT